MSYSLNRLHITRTMKLIALFVVCVVAQVDSEQSDQSDWENYKACHSKVYKPEEDSQRLNIYMDNKMKIAEHNVKYMQGDVSYRVGINQFTDMLLSEYKTMMNGIKKASNVPGMPYVDNGKATAVTVDWRNMSVVTPVKNQQQCGSCWAFSATGSLEGQHALKTGKLVSLSEQNLVDCSHKYGNAGCNGGMPDYAFNYIKANGGIDTESSYPYNGTDGECTFNKANVGATVCGHVNLPSGDECSLKNAVSKIGPISVGIDASNWSFQMYCGGVYCEPNCSSTALDHGVLVVGYGTENCKDYWLVKNSWGTTWGEAGYIKMSRNVNNQCGIATMASYPLV